MTESMFESSREPNSQDPVFAITRRQVFGCAAAPLLGLARSLGEASMRGAGRIRLETSTPWAELAGICRSRGLPMPRRVVARPEPHWWPHARELPPRWEAWVELEGGAAFVIECRPARGLRQESPERISAFAAIVAQALRG